MKRFRKFSHLCCSFYRVLLSQTHETTNSRELRATRVVFHQSNRASAYGLMLFFIVVAFFAIPEYFLGVSGVEPWKDNSVNQTFNYDYTAVILWLVAANTISITSVGILLGEIWGLSRKLLDVHTSLNEERAVVLLGQSSKVIERLKKSKAFNSWATRPLSGMYWLSLTAIGLNLIVCIAPWIISRVSEWMLFIASMLTGSVYLLLMTVSDICAIHSYRRTLCLTVADSSSSTGIQDFHSLLESLSDYERIFWYVDLPFLSAALLTLIHGFLLHNNSDPYRWGVVAGATALNIILANIISLLISASETTVLEPA